MEQMMFPDEEWILSNVLSSTDLYEDELHGFPCPVRDDEFLKDSLSPTDQFYSLSVSDDSGINTEFDSWLEEATSIPQLDVHFVAESLPQTHPDDAVADLLAQLEAALDPIEEFDAHAEFSTGEKLILPLPDIPSSPMQAPCSPMEMSSLKPSINGTRTPVVKYLRPYSIDTSFLSNQAQIVMDDLNVLHLPEPDCAQEAAAVILLEALVKTEVELAAGELLSFPDCLPSSAPLSPVTDEVPGSPASAESDEEFIPHRSKRKASSQDPNQKSVKVKKLKPGETRQRKKQQNKTAATKYRHKKRFEDEVIKKELNQLESKNTSLKRQFEDLNSEIKYMKGLLNEVLKDKGLRIK